MKKLLSLLVLIISFTSCKSDKSTNNSKFSDLNLYFETDIEIDSVFISNITQDREYMFLPHQETMKIDLKDSINDLYNINFYTKKGLLMNQMWLRGNTIHIKGRVSKKVEIDTVIGSKIYYSSVDFKKQYNALLKTHSDDSTKINSFLIQTLKDNLDNPFSIHASELFFYRNISNKRYLKELYTLLVNQEDNIKNHLLNPIKKIENILSVDHIDFSQYQFYNRDNESTQVSLKADKRYLIDLWFVNCPPCVKDHKLIQQQQDWFKEQNIELIGISVDKDNAIWSSYLDGNSYNWANYREQSHNKNRLAHNMVITSFPTYLLIDGAGKIMHRTHSFTAIQKQLNN